MVVTHQSLSKDEKNINQLIHRMGEAVSHAFQQAGDAYMEHNSELAQSVIDDDAKINDLCARIEEHCFITIALRQPVANDLRDLLANMHIAQEYERIGDYAADISKKIIETHGMPKKGCRDNFQLLIDLCSIMLEEASELLESPDEDVARNLAAQDDKVDETEKVIVRALIQQMREDPDSIENCIHAVAIAHKMERIADRITNIAEQVIFSRTGKTVELG